MTNREAFIYLSNSSEPVAKVDIALQLEGINPEGIYSPTENRCKFYKSLLDFMSRSNFAVKSISEGEYSISFDTDSKAKFLYNMALDSGCEELIDKYSLNPKIRDKSFLW